MNPIDRYTCAEVFKRLDDFLDRHLTPDEARLVEQHLADCARCAMEHQFERQVIDSVRQKLARIEVPKDLLANIITRLRQATDA